MAKKVEAARDTQRATPPEGKARRWAAAKAELDKEVVMVDKMQDNIKELEMMAEHATQDAQEAREVAHVESMPPDMRENVEAFHDLLTDKAEQTAALYRETARRLKQVIEGTSEAVKLSVKAFTPLMQSFTEHAEELREIAETWRILGPYIDAETKEHPEIYGDDEHPDVGADVPLEVLIAAAAKRARADGVEVPTLAAEEATETLAKGVIFTPGEKALSFSGKAVSVLSRARTRGQVSIFGDSVTFDDFLISSKAANKLGVGEAKLLRYGISAFTEANAQNNKNIKLRVYADTKEFARACRIRIDRQQMPTPEEQIEEDKRAAKAFNNFMGKLIKNAQALTDASFSWTERIQGKTQSFTTMNILGMCRITRDEIIFEFTQVAAEYLTRLPLAVTPSAYYAINDRMINAFAIADKLIQHYSMYNNVVRNTERILKIETLLKYTSFPSIDEVRQKRNSWVKLIKEPFEAAMDELYQKGLIAEEKTDPKTGKHISGGWRYSLAGKQELSETQAAAIIENGYAYFASLYIVFDLAGYEPHEVRAQAIAAEKAKSLEKANRKPRTKKERPTPKTKGET